MRSNNFKHALGWFRSPREQFNTECIPIHIPFPSKFISGSRQNFVVKHMGNCALQNQCPHWSVKHVGSWCKFLFKMQFWLMWCDKPSKFVEHLCLFLCRFRLAFVITLNYKIFRFHMCWKTGRNNSDCESAPIMILKIWPQKQDSAFNIKSCSVECKSAMVQCCSFWSGFHFFFGAELNVGKMQWNSEINFNTTCNLPQVLRAISSLNFFPLHYFNFLHR